MRRLAVFLAPAATALLAAAAVHCGPNEELEASAQEAPLEQATGTTCAGAERLIAGTIRDRVGHDKERFYWLHEPAAGGFPRLASVARDGSEPQIHALTFETPTATLQGVDATHLYFIDGMKVVRVAKQDLAAADAAPARETVYEGKTDRGVPLELRLGTSVLYLLAGRPSSVFLTVAKAGGKPTLRLSNLFAPMGLTFAKGRVYFSIVINQADFPMFVERIESGEVDSGIAPTLPIDEEGVYSSGPARPAGGGQIARYAVSGTSPILRIDKPAAFAGVFLSGSTVHYAQVDTSKAESTLRASIWSTSAFGFAGASEGKLLVKGLRVPSSVFEDGEHVYWTELNPGGGGLFRAPKKALEAGPITCSFTPDDKLDAFDGNRDAGAPDASAPPPDNDGGAAADAAAEAAADAAPSEEPSAGRPSRPKPEGASPASAGSGGASGDAPASSNNKAKVAASCAAGASGRATGRAGWLVALAAATHLVRRRRRPEPRSC
jgi:hypothetical protein